MEMATDCVGVLTCDSCVIDELQKSTAIRPAIISGASTCVQLHAYTQAKAKACCTNEEPCSSFDSSAYNLISSSLFQLEEGK